MENNDIGFTVHQHIACMFEGLLMLPQPQAEPGEDAEETTKRVWFRKKKKESEAAPVSNDDWVNSVVRRWRPNEMPLKSVIHLTTKLGIGVEVYTYLDPVFREHIEHWLARKGATVQVYCYDDVAHLAEDLRYNRDVHTLFTPYEEDAKIFGWHRATVVQPDGSFGF